MSEDKNDKGVVFELLNPLIEGRKMKEEKTESFVGAKIALGSQVREMVTGFEGTVTGVAKYLTGCYQYSVVPQMSKKNFEDGTSPDAMWYDEGRLEVITQKITEEDVQTTENGGPNSDAPSVY